MSSVHAVKTHDRQVEHCVELICQKGCQQTRIALTNLQQSIEIEEVSHLSPYQRDLVLEELIVIMSVYGDSCTI